MVTQLPVDGFNDNERENHIWSGGKLQCYDIVEYFTIEIVLGILGLLLNNGFLVKALC